MKALVIQQHHRSSLAKILSSQGWADETQLLDYLCQHANLPRISPRREDVDEGTLALQSAGFWLRHVALPLRRDDGDTVIVLADPDSRPQLSAALRPQGRKLRFALACPTDIQAVLTPCLAAPLAAMAAHRVAADVSCRDWQDGRSGRRLMLGLAGLITCVWVFPGPIFALFSLMAALILMLFLMLKLVGVGCRFLARDLGRAPPVATPLAPSNGRIGQRLPQISVLVPLYREDRILGALLDRLRQLRYPRDLLEILLVLEEGDSVTAAGLQACPLPPWIRSVTVPALGGLTTKPRAMNYALEFCRGDIIGVWDAEDAPAPDQLEHVVQAFATAPPDVVCLQGVLDYYAPRRNWLSRCFTLEYASWFRVVLPGLARLGLVVPLGGTTVFLRRAALEHLGGWDAHNVTEDADLGVRLCRAGYSTRMLATATYEEPNCRPWPWIRQRSRWIKGFMMTYGVHMRRPGLLLRQLGWARFLGVQAFFLGTAGQFLLAPVLWSLWLVLLGLPHPGANLLPAGVLRGLLTVLLCYEAVSLAIAMAAAILSRRSDLALWAPTLPLYFPLGTIAAYKALYELLWQPFYWDKTTHGLEQAEPGGAGTAPG